MLSAKRVLVAVRWTGPITEGQKKDKSIALPRLASVLLFVRAGEAAGCLCACVCVSAGSLD